MTAISLCCEWIGVATGDEGAEWSALWLVQMGDADDDGVKVKSLEVSIRGKAERGHYQGCLFD